MKNSLGIVVVIITALIYVSDQRGIENAVRKLFGRDAQSSGFAFELRNQTKEVGLHHIHEAAKLDKRFENVEPYVAAVGASIAAVDLDGSGWYDLFLTTSSVGGLNRYYRNNRDGTFTDVAKDLGIADLNRPFPAWRSVFTDYDRDGLKDLFLFSYCPRVFKNSGRQGFKEVFDHGLQCGVFYGGLNALEVNRSGALSFIVSPYLMENLFAPKTTKIFPNNFSGESNGRPALFYQNLGNGRFVEQSKKFGFTHKGWGHAVGVYDLRGIGRRDIWFPEDYNFERVYLNETNSAAGAEPSEHFKDQGEILAKTGFGRNGMGVDIADVDNDGRPLVFVTHIYTQGYKLSGNSLWKVVERENGKFSVVQEAGERGVADCGWAWGGRFVDFDNDGSLELFVTNGFVSASKKKSYWYTMSVLDAAGPTILEDSLNWPPIKEASIDGYQRSCLFIKGQDGRFTDIASETALADELLDGRGFVAIDFMNTGSPSLAIVNHKAETVFYMNEQKNKNSWLGFRFKGQRSNPEGWGTRVVVSMKEKKLMRELQPLNGYASQSEDRILIGLGAAPEILEIEVQWPSGIRQKLKPLALNQYHTIVEPEK